MPVYLPDTCSPRTNSSPVSPGPEHGSVVGADLHLDAGHRLTDRTQPARDGLVGCAERGAVVVGGEHGDGRAGLGQAVGVDEADVGQQRQRLAHQRQCDLRSAVGQRAQRRQRGRLGFEHGDDAVEHGRHHRGRGDALVRRPGAPIRAASKLRQVHHLSARVQIRQRRADAGDVVGRHADQRRVLGRPRSRTPRCR